MHPISFLQKRAHLCAVARGREMFAHVPAMTPARFDILYVVYNAIKFPGQRRPCGFTIEEHAIREKLGLARQTIAEAVKRLAELGLVERTLQWSMGRLKNIVTLTEEGLRVTRLALNAAFSERRQLPSNAPAVDAPRYWMRPELADPNDTRPMLGREVEKIYTTFAWELANRRRGRRGARARHLEELDRIISFMAWIATRLGNTTRSIYEIAYTRATDH